MPSRCVVVAAMNPCPCGHLGDPGRECSCPPQRLSAYRSRLSGPLLDRFDLRVDAPRIDAHGSPGEGSETVAGRVALARQAIAETPPQLSDAARALLERAVQVGKLSGRASDRATAVARSIAALAGCELIDADHMAEALSYRGSV